MHKQELSSKIKSLKGEWIAEGGMIFSEDDDEIIRVNWKKVPTGYNFQAFLLSGHSSEFYLSSVGDLKDSHELIEFLHLLDLNTKTGIFKDKEVKQDNPVEEPDFETDTKGRSEVADRYPEVAEQREYQRGRADALEVLLSNRNVTLGK